MKKTMQDIAVLAGVSRTVVSRVLSGNYEKVRISKETAEKVLVVAKEHGFKPNELARSLQASQTKTIGVIVTDITNPFFASIARSIEKNLDVAGYSMILSNSDENEATETKYIDMLLSRKVDGLIICPSGYEDANIFRLEAGKIPVALIDRYVKNEMIGFVVSDNYESAKRIVSYLVEKGHRKIAYIGGGEDASTNFDRKKGYRDALAEAGLKPVKEMEIDSEFNKKSGEEVMDKLLRLKERPTAVFAANNFLGLGVLASISKNGLKIPEDVSLVQFDETDLSMHGPVPVTSVVQDTEEIGRNAAEEVLSRIKGGEPRKIVVPAKFVERSSVKEMTVDK